MRGGRQAELGTFGPGGKALGPNAPPVNTAMTDAGEAVDDMLRPVCGTEPRMPDYLTGSLRGMTAWRAPPLHEPVSRLPMTGSRDDPSS